MDKLLQLGTAFASSRSDNDATADETKELVDHLDTLLRPVLSTSKWTAEEKVFAVLNAVQQIVEAPAIEEAAQRLSSNCKKRPVRVFLDGCFDLMHSGHYNALRQAKLLGDQLVVGVHSDAEILQNKGPPIMNNEERMEMVKSCKWVDEVVFDTPYSPSIAFLDSVNADFCVHGDDMPVMPDGTTAYDEVKEAGRCRIIKRTEGISTTDIVGRLLLMTRNTFSTSPTPVTASQITNSEPFSDSSNTTNSKNLGRVNKIVTHLAQSSENSTPRYAVKNNSSFLATTCRITAFSNGRTPKEDDVVIYVDGAFDLFHIGHVEGLKQAKAMGTFLYVGIHDDEIVNKHKGLNNPVMNLNERVLNVLSCKYVDEVIIGAPWIITKDMITTLNISVVCAGQITKVDPAFDPSNEDPYAVPKQLGIYREHESRGFSTAKFIQRIVDNRRKYEQRNLVRVQKENDYLKTKKFVEEL